MYAVPEFEPLKVIVKLFMFVCVTAASTCVPSASFIVTEGNLFKLAAIVTTAITNKAKPNIEIIRSAKYSINT